MFKNLFKSKAMIEEEKLQEEWTEELVKAYSQLRSSGPECGQINHLLSLLEGKEIECWVPRLRVLTEAKLYDRKPFFGIFYLKPIGEHEPNRCRLAIHDTRIVEFIDRLGFARISMGGPDIFKNAGSQVISGLESFNFNVIDDLKLIVEKANKYYMGLKKLEEDIASKGDKLFPPQFSSLCYTLSGFSISAQVMPNRVDAIIASLPADSKYIKEYREYLIKSLAEKSIEENSPSRSIRRVGKITYDQPLAYCMTYDSFEKQHDLDLERESKNKEFEAVIEEIEAYARNKIDTEI